MISVYCLLVISVIINRASTSGGLQCQQQHYLDVGESICKPLPSNFSVLSNVTQYTTYIYVGEDSVLSADSFVFGITVYINNGTFMTGNIFYLELTSAPPFKFSSTGGATTSIIIFNDANKDLFLTFEYTVEALVNLDPGFYQSSILLNIFPVGNPSLILSPVDFSVNITELPPYECNSTDCANEGTCVPVSPVDYICTCFDGYFGDSCEVNPCKPNPCQYGNCSGVSSIEYSCNCTVGYTGENCTIDIDDCIDTNCGNGHCIDLINDYRCDCEPGYTGRNCMINIDDCLYINCGNGRCIDLTNGYKCNDCPKNQYLNVSDLESPCKPISSNFSVLLNATQYNTHIYVDEGSELSADSSVFGITMYINNGTFMSSNIFHLELNSALFKFSSTGGTTTDIIVFNDENEDLFLTFEYTVEASDDLDPGFYQSSILFTVIGNPSLVLSPVHFSVNIMEWPPYQCNGTECDNGGTCVPGSFIYYNCDCVDGYFGDTCEIDPCEPDPCQYGTCSGVSATEYSCACIAGYTGQNCTIDIDDCVNITCGSDRYCVDVINGYECNQCPESYYLDVSESACKYLPSNFSVLLNATQYDIKIQIEEESILSADISVFGITLYINNGTFMSNNIFHLELNSALFKFSSTGGGSTDIIVFNDVNKDLFLTFRYTVEASEDINPGFYQSSVLFTVIGNPSLVLSPVHFSVNITELPPYHCNGTECANGGTCVPVSSISFRCDCADGYFGDSCEIDPCEPDPCQYGTCSGVSATEYSCNCTTGYTGENCMINIDDCLYINCASNARCIDLINGYTCSNCSTNQYLNVSDVENPCKSIPSNFSVLLNATQYNVKIHVGEESVLSADSFVFGLTMYINNGTFMSSNIFHLELTSALFKFSSTGGGSTDIIVFNEENKDLFLTFRYTVEASNDLNPGFYQSSILFTVIGNPSLVLSPVDFSLNITEKSLYICDGTECANGGTCVPGIESFSCDCIDGYFGDKCENASNPCESNPCSTNGTCSPVSAIEYNCTCNTAGFTGLDCSLNIDDCIDINCGNGSCIDLINDYRCDCLPGYTGDGCLTDINECEPSQCVNGICQDQVNGYTCCCYPDWTGVNCEIDNDLCFGGDFNNPSFPCDTIGYRNCSDGNGTFVCDCRAGFTGLTCDTDINECADDPCLNAGTCHDNINAYSCTCGYGYTGTSCDVVIDFCVQLGTTCSNNGNCSNIEGIGTECICYPGYTGSNCSIDLDYCNDSYCLNNGTCMEGHGIDITCNCALNYKGDKCQTPYCPVERCFKDGLCNVLTNKTLCECDPKQSCFCDEDCIDSPIDSVIAYPTNQTVYYSDTTSFNCTTLVNEPSDNTFHWVKGIPTFKNNIINSSDFDSLLVVGLNSSLTVTASNGSVGGVYSCVVFNKAGYGIDTVALYISPVVLIQPVDQYTQYSNIVELLCVGDSYPPAVYQWQKMNQVTMEFETLVGKNASYLIFTSIEYDDNGIYRCLVNSDVSILPHGAISEACTITVSPAGSVAIDPPLSVINSFNGTTVTLTCNAEGGPGNVFQWTRQVTGTKVATSSQFSVLLTVSTAGEYKCTVSNLAGNESNSTIINVGPIITEGPSSLNVSLIHHTNVTSLSLTCIAIGEPLPYITWTHDDVILNNGGSDQVENGISISTVVIDSLGTVKSILTIDNVLLNHTGLYQCIAVSTVIEYDLVESETAIVLIQDVPAAPYNFTSLTINSQSVTLLWGRPNDNNAPILHYTVHYTQPSFLGGSEVKVQTSNGNTESLIIDNLHPGELYNFTVIAVNKEGNSGRSESLTIKTLEEKPSGFPADLSTISVTSITITLSWNPVPQNETNGVITHYNITWKMGGSSNEFNMAVDESVLSVQLSGLEEFVVYRICISAATGEGCGPCSPEVSIRTSEAAPSSPPTSLSVWSYTANTIALKWAEPLPIDINGIIDQYVIKYYVMEKLGVANVSMAIYEVTIMGNTTLNATLDGLDSYTVYEISVAAITIGEGPSAAIIQRTDENAPDAPPNFVTVNTLSSTAVFIAWAPPPLYLTNGIIDGYEIQYGRYSKGSGDIHIDIATLLINGNDTFNQTIEDLQEYIEYGFQVRAITIAPGPYSELVLNTTLQAVPSTHPGVAVDAVPNSTLRATSVILTWNHIPADDANGDLRYRIIISVIDQATSDSSTRRRRQALTNTLGQCLSEAGIKTSMVYETPGNESRVFINNIAPWVEYSFIVAGITDVGIGPFSPPVHFITPEGVPSEPHNVYLNIINSTSLELKWTSPLCDNGMRIGYRLYIFAILGPNPIGELPANVTREIYMVDASMQTFTELTPNSPYQVTICALTNSGCGANVTVNQTTQEDAPNPVSNVVIEQPSTNDKVMIVSWLSPSNRNGSFNISLSYTATQVFVYQQRIRNVLGELIVIGSDDDELKEQSVVLTGVLPYAEYKISIIVYNRIMGKSLSSEPVNVSSTSNPTKSSNVTDLSVQPLTVSQALVKWEVPLYPNGPISYYEVCIDGSGAICHITHSNATHYLLQNLKSLETYDITVQPVTLYNGFPLKGQLSIRLTVKMDTLASSDSISDTNTVSSSRSSLTVDLPDYPSTYKGDPIVYYGLIVASSGSCNIVTDYGSVYSNPRPYSNKLISNYYIAGGWNNASKIPDIFVIGNGISTNAIRLNGEREIYSNPMLMPDSLYCIVALIYLETGIPDLLKVRYGGLVVANTTASKTEFQVESVPISTVAIVFIAFTIFLLIAILCLSLIVIGCVLSRKFHSRSMSFDPHLTEGKSRQDHKQPDIELVDQTHLEDQDKHIYETTETVSTESPQKPSSDFYDQDIAAKKEPANDY